MQTKQKFTTTIDKRVLKEYRRACTHLGYKLSSRVEVLIKLDLTQMHEMMQQANDGRIEYEEEEYRVEDYRGGAV